MICPRCHNQRMVWSGEFDDGRGLRAGRMIPCPRCQGMEPSCCDGPVGEPDEVPSDPNEGGGAA